MRRPDTSVQVVRFCVRSESTQTHETTMKFLSPLLPLVLLTVLSSTVRAGDPGAPESTLPAGRTLHIDFSIEAPTLALVEADGPNVDSLIPPQPSITSVGVVAERGSFGTNLAGGCVLAGLGLWRNRRVVSAGCFSGARRIRHPDS